MMIVRMLKAWDVLRGRDRDEAIITELVRRGYLYLNPNVGWVWGKKLP